MFRRNTSAAMAAAALGVVCTMNLAHSQETPVLARQSPLAAVDSPPPAPAPATAPATPEAERRPLMDLLSLPGLAQPLEKAHINIYGYFEGSFTHNFDDPRSDTNFGRVFDFASDRAMFNQFDLSIERAVNPNKTDWDVGGKMEWIWGEDAGSIHSNGLFDWYSLQRIKGASHNSPEDQWDLNQAYVDLAIPIGNGLKLRAGKFVTLMGYETINPTVQGPPPSVTPFLSHSYLFGFAIPFTQTGIMAAYQVNDNWLIQGGGCLGWDQSLNDNNDALSWFGNVTFTSNDKKLGLIGQFITGPEETDNSRDWRTVIDTQITYQFTDKFLLAANADFGWEQNVAAGAEDAFWYGIAGYAQYKLNDYITLNARAEWFRDEEGVRLGTLPGNYYEVTLGATIQPFPKQRGLKTLFFRPELRGDWASHDVFNDGGDSSMYTIAVDAIYMF